MTPIIEKELAPGVRLRGFHDSRFKTMRISVHMIVPMRPETAAVYAVLPAVMSRVCRAYPDYTQMSRYLCDLYGASMTTGVRRMGDCQVLSIHASSIADRYALDGRRVSTQLAELLTSILFDPYFDPATGTFPEESIRQEKRQIMELIDSEFSDKQAYAAARCEELLYADEPSGIGRCGKKEDVAAVDGTALRKAWETLLDTAVFEIFVMGNCDPENIAPLFSAPFAGRSRKLCTLETTARGARCKVQRVEEMQPVEQSKLVMGFRMEYDDTLSRDAVRLMNMLFGSSPSSKLFMNVREKQSLCYYCSSRCDTLKKSMFVESGIETCNLQAVEDAVLEQLKEMQAGHFSEDDMQKARLGLANSCRTVYDYLGATETWYLSQILRDEVRTPDEDIEAVRRVTREEIIRAANAVQLDTVYVLRGREQA